MADDEVIASFPALDRRRWRRRRKRVDVRSWRPREKADGGGGGGAPAVTLPGDRAAWRRRQTSAQSLPVPSSPQWRIRAPTSGKTIVITYVLLNLLSEIYKAR